jgi:hypothetical protein
MGPGGQFYPAGSDYANALAAGNALDPNFYDSSGAWVGAEGPQGAAGGMSMVDGNLQWGSGLDFSETPLGIAIANKSN